MGTNLYEVLENNKLLVVLAIAGCDFDAMADEPADWLGSSSDMATVRAPSQEKVS